MTVFLSFPAVDNTEIMLERKSDVVELGGKTEKCLQWYQMEYNLPDDILP